MKQYKLSEVAEVAGVNRATVYRWVKRHRATLGDNLVDTPNGQMITEKGLSLLLRATGATARVATDETAPATGATGRDSAVQQFEERLQEYKEREAKLQERLERAEADLRRKDDLVREMINNQQTERHRSDSIIYNLTSQVREQAILIEDLRQQRQEARAPEYETVDVEAVQDEIMDVDKADEDLVQDVVVEEVCEEPPAAAAEPVRESLEAEEQEPAPVMAAVAQAIEPEGQGNTAAAAVEKVGPAPQEKRLEKQSHPKHSWGMFKRLWVNMFQPELLRGA